MEHFQLNPIGKIRQNDGGAYIELDQSYIPGLQALEGFSHINVYGGSAIVIIPRTGRCCRLEGMDERPFSVSILGQASRQRQPEPGIAI